MNDVAIEHRPTCACKYRRSAGFRRGKIYDLLCAAGASTRREIFFTVTKRARKSSSKVSRTSVGSLATKSLSSGKGSLELRASSSSSCSERALGARRAARGDSRAACAAGSLCICASSSSSGGPSSSPPAGAVGMGAAASSQSSAEAAPEGSTPTERGATTTADWREGAWSERGNPRGGGALAAESTT